MKRINSMKIWDFFTFLAHWSIALVVFVNYVLNEEGGDVHQYLGYIAAALVACRLVWGGIRRLKRQRRTGSGWIRLLNQWVKYLIWGCLIGLGVSGWLMGLDAFWGNETLEELHEVLANGLIGLVALHVAAMMLLPPEQTLAAP